MGSKATHHIPGAQLRPIKPVPGFPFPASPDDDPTVITRQRRNAGPPPVTSPDENPRVITARPDPVPAVSPDENPTVITRRAGKRGKPMP